MIFPMAWKLGVGVCALSLLVGLVAGGCNQGGEEGTGPLSAGAADGGPPSGGSGDPGAPSPGGSSHVGPDPADPCEYTLEQIADDLENDYAMPTWEMLDCFRQGLTRSRPAFVTRLLAVGDLPGIGPGGGPRQHLIHLEYWDRLWKEHPVSVSSHLFGTMGPFRTNAMEDIHYPLYPTHLDARMRKGMVAVLREKQAGRPVVLAQFVPPGDDIDGIPLFETADEYRAYAREIWIPWHVELAKVAERFQVDYFAAANELDALFQRQSILLQKLPPAEQVALVQWLIDELRAAVRPHYGGVLLAYSYVRYGIGDDHWMDLSYAGYDEVAFPLIPECDVEGLRKYVHDQMLGYARIVERSGIPWRVSELDIVRKLFETSCGRDFEAIEADLYREAFRILDDPPMPSKPIGVSVLAKEVTTAAAWEVIDAYFQAHR